MHAAVQAGLPSHIHRASPSTSLRIRWVDTLRDCLGSPEPRGRPLRLPGLWAGAAGLEELGGSSSGSSHRKVTDSVPAIVRPEDNHAESWVFA